eukprot:253628-Amphidinium_carterae.1
MDGLRDVWTPATVCAHVAGPRAFLTLTVGVFVKQIGKGKTHTEAPTTELDIVNPQHGLDCSSTLQAPRRALVMLPAWMRLLPCAIFHLLGKWQTLGWGNEDEAEWHHLKLAAVKTVTLAKFKEKCGVEKSVTYTGSFELSDPH